MAARHMKGSWWVDFHYENLRIRKRSPVDTKRGAEEYERKLRTSLLDGSYWKKEVEPPPTVAEFKDRFIRDHCEANRHKPSGIEGKQYAFRQHILPLLGKKQLDQLTNEDVAKLKGRMTKKAPATTNNALSALSTMLKVAVEWGVIERVPCTIRLLKRQQPAPKFYDFDEYGWLLEAAEKIDERIRLMALLGGDAGLRRGEIIALELTDCDLRRGLLTVQRSEWKGQVTETKGMEYRVVPMTARLREALTANRHLKGDRVLYTDAGETVTAKVLQKWMARAQKRANLRATGGLHLLRHTFCSHLAMKGAPALSIQKLAGHKHLQTTLRYMHLSPGETERAIRLLEGGAPGTTATSVGHHLGTNGENGRN